MPDASVLVLANPECAHCVQALDVVTDWAFAERVPVAGMDVRARPEFEARWDLETSPVLVFRSERGERVHVGMPAHDEFVRLAHGR